MELYINSHLLYLKESTKIRMTMVNPLFSDAGLFSYMVRVDRDRNETFFAHYNAIDAGEETALTFRLIVGGEPFAEGDVVVTDSSDTESIVFYLKSGNSSAAAFFQNTYLDETGIFGYISRSGVTYSLNGCYPQYPAVATPVKVKEDVFNYFDFESGSVKMDRYDHCCPAVYLRHIIDKTINHLGFLKVRDDFSLFNDFNRLALFTPKKDGIRSDQNIIRHLMPHRTLQYLKEEILKRFNMAIYLSPYTNEAEIIHIDTVFNLPPIDITNKFKGYGKIAPPAEKPLLMTHEGEKDDLLTPEEIEERYNRLIQTVNEMSELPEQSDYIYKVSGINRYMKCEKVDPENDLMGGYYLKKSTVSYAGESFYEILQSYLGEFSKTETNSITTADTDNHIAQFIYPQLKGEVTTSYYQEVNCKVDSGSADLIIEIFVRNDAGSEDVLTRHTATVDWTTMQSHKYLFRLPASATLTETNRMGVRFYSRAATAGRTITIEFSGVHQDGGGEMECYTAIDYPFYQWREIGICGNYRYGSQDKKPEEFKSETPVLKNDLVQMGGYLFEMPVCDITPENVQKDFAWIIYRGKGMDELTGSVYAGYSNFDWLNLSKEAYANDMQGGGVLDLSLRWTGPHGLVDTLWKKRLLWERHYKRPVRLKLDYTTHDLTTNKPYHPVMVNNMVYLLDKIVFTLNVKGEIEGLEADAYTI